MTTREERVVLVSVIVAVRGNVPALHGLLNQLRAQRFSGQIQVVVVDNHRHRWLLLDELVSAGDLVVHEPRAGVSRARNTGVRHAQAGADYLLFTDPDARPDPSWVRALVGELERTGAYCAGGRVVPRVLGVKNPPALDPNLQQLFVPDSWPAHTMPVRAPYRLAGCNLATRCWPTQAFDECLGARGHRRLSCEDTELVHRVQHEGREVIVVPDAVVSRAIHVRELRLPALLRRAFGHGVSTARLHQRHPDSADDDSTRFRDVVAARHSARATVVHLARVAGRRLATTRAPREEAETVAQP